MNKIRLIYDLLLENYGFQGWWPINGKYNPNNYSYPRTAEQRFEICVGAILTQNTSWKQVEKALENLRRMNALNPQSITSFEVNKLKQAIKPAGYFNQKARKLKEFTTFFLQLKKEPTREELLSIWGVGPETADSILLYAYKKPLFVIDAYTKRVFNRIGFKEKTYDELQKLFMNNLKPDYKLFNEYHALIVEHAKKLCAKKPDCGKCFLNRMCKKIIR